MCCSLNSRDNMVPFYDNLTPKMIYLLAESFNKFDSKKTFSESKDNDDIWCKYDIYLISEGIA